MVDMGY
jgi:uncharacterized membrane protein